MRVHAGYAEREFMQHGLAEDDRAGMAQAGYYVGVLRRRRRP